LAVAFIRHVTKRSCYGQAVADQIKGVDNYEISFKVSIRNPRAEKGRLIGSRVVRGGAFNNNPRNVRCAVRNRNNPNNWNDNVGFRVALSTLFYRWNCLAPMFFGFQAETKNGGA
jgi:hypothetical protein